MKANIFQMESWNTGMDGRGECRLTAQEMDEMRQQNVAYQYLCHLEEARKWMEACIEEEVVPVEGLEEQLRHGVYLAKLAHFFAPDTVPLRKVFDADLSRYNAGGLHFRHTDNINHFLRGLKAIGLPSIFYPETTDIYDGKNMPRVVFCLHALSLYLFRLGIAPQIQNLYGKVKFSDEVMTAMMSELNKYGCQMPQFGKIGGILASELPVDEAALHAAIIAINEAVDKQDVKELLDTLENPTCHLEHVDPEHGEAYLQTLAVSKQRKKDLALEKSRDESYIPDAYDELLTHVEIQGHVNSTNVLCALIKVEDAVVEERKSDLIAALQLPYLMLKDVEQKNVTEYIECLKEEMDRPHEQSLDLSLNYSLAPCSISRTMLRQVIQRVNKKENAHNQLLEAVKLVNRSLECGSPEQTLEALKSFGSNITKLLDFAAPLYHEEMAAMQEDMQGDLTLEEIQGGMKMLTAVAHINATLRTHSPQELLHYLQAPSAYLQGVDEHNGGKYLSAMMMAAKVKNTSQESCPLLTYLDLQTVIDDVNQQVQEDSEKIGALTNLNSALDRDSVHEAMTALNHPALKLKGIKTYDALHHFHLLKLLRTAKREMLEDDTVELWIEDLSDCVRAVNRHVEEAESLVTIMMGINQGLADGDCSLVAHLLEDKSFFKVKTSQESMLKIVERLNRLAEEKRKSPVGSNWLKHYLRDGSKVFLNMESGKYQWEEPKELGTVYITPDDVFSITEEVDMLDHNKRKVEEVIIRFQALARGFLVRQRHKEHQRAAIIIQSWWRMQCIRQVYSRYCTSLHKFEPQIVTIQRAVRAWLHRRRIKALSSHFTKHEHHVLVIQRAWRSYKARQDLRALTHCDKPSLAVVRKFLHLLDVSATDFIEELRLQKVKNDIVKTIRRTHNLENEVDQMDVKIGLLVHNRITLQDVIPVEKENVNPNVGETGGSKKNRKGSKELPRYSTIKVSKGLKALTKESREKLVGYQHLFYLLQTQPHYLATLIFALPPSKTTKFIENVIFTLYNYGSSDRDSYLLLKLFKTALEEEIRCKVLRLSDIVSGNPLVVKMIVSFNRKGAGQASLQEMLGPLVRKVLSDSNIQINTNPVEIYQTWVNQKEMQTGQPSGLPYVVTQEDAVKYPEVQKRLSRAIQSLKEATAAFCDHITSSRHLIPYAMLYMAKVLRAALHRRFPHIPEKEILKVVGNLVYYRYINSAIVAPDAFDIVTVSPDQKLTSDQRRNLASIAKVLQFAASKKGFGEEEAAHLTCLNPFIIECHEKFKIFFRECCEVEDPEDVYNVNQYSEATLIIKPTVYITVQEMCETHQLLLDNESILAPDSSDPLHELLSDLGERPALHTLIGESPVESNTAACGRTEVCLALTSKFDIPENIEDSKDLKDSSKLFNRAKQMLIEVITCVEGDQITALVSGATTAKEESKYRQLVMNRAENERQAKLNDTALNRSNSFMADARVNLHDIKTRLSHNLRRLENQGLASRSDNYQTLLNAIAQDIVNQREYRISRKQELYRHLTTEKQLEAKEKFYKDQLESYKTYLNTCLSNMAVRNKNVHQASSKLGKKELEKVRSKATLKYTAWRLYEKGVVLEIEGLPESQLKNVLFEITPLATTGVFQVQVKFMGVAMETVQVDIQDLLQLQYEGVSVKQMMRKAKVNVNLLLHLLNTKFYSKKK